MDGTTLTEQVLDGAGGGWVIHSPFCRVEPSNIMFVRICDAIGISVL